jgi:hypothetical protein
MRDKVDEIKEFLCLEEVYLGKLELFPEFGFGDSIIGVNYCLYVSKFEVENVAYNEKLGFPFNIEKFRPDEGRINLIKGDRLIVFSKNGLHREKEIIINADGPIGKLDSFFALNATESDVALWFKEERIAKLYRKKGPVE